VFYSIAQTAQKIGVSVSMVAAKLSVAIPVIFALFIHNETLGVLKVAGILVSLVAVYFISQNSSSKNNNASLWYLPLYVFLGSGLIDTILNHINKTYIPPFNTNHILSFVFLTAFVLGALLLVYQLVSAKKMLSIKSIGWGIALGIPNYMCMYFLLKTLGAFTEASIVLPINNIGIVMASTLTGVFVFKEHLSTFNKIGLMLAIASIVILSLS
jgi:drug/metabolite transporter (DMT)-like permease